MLPPLVLVDVAPQDAPAEHVDALLGACTQAVGGGGCARLGDGAADAPSRAWIDFEAGGASVVDIEVEQRAEDGRSVRHRRTLRFRGEDPPLERFRAAGLIAGTLAATPSPVPDAPPPAPSSPPSTVAPVLASAPPEVVPPAETAEAHPVWIDLGAIAGTALDDGTWRAGATGRVAYALDAVPLFGAAGASYSVRPSDDTGLTVRWVALSAGGGVYLVPHERVTVDFGFDVVVERLDASVVDPATGRGDDSGRWAAGSRIGLRSALWLHPQLGVAGGVSASLLQRGSVIELRGQLAARAPALSAQASLGLRARLP